MYSIVIREVITMQVQSIVQQLLEVVCPGMHWVRRASLAASVLGALRGRRLTVTAIGRALPGRTSQKHAIKRADRLLSNRHLHAQRVQHYQDLCRLFIGVRTRPVLLIDWSDLDACKRHFLLRASLAVNSRSITVYEEVHTLKTKEKRRTHRAFLRQLQALLPVGCRPIIVTDAGFRTPWFQQVASLGWDWVGRIRNRHKMRWCSGGRWFGAKRCYQRASRVAKYLGQAMLTRANPQICHLVVYRGKAQGRKHITRSGKVAQDRRSRACAARAREPWLLATSLPVTTKLAKQVVRLYRLRMSIEEGFRDMKSHQFGLGLTYHRCASVERLQVLVFIATLALLVLWLVGTATTAQGAHYQFQANSVRHKRILSVLFIGLQMVQDSRIILTRAAMKTAWSALRELRYAEPWPA